MSVILTQVSLLDANKTNELTSGTDCYGFLCLKLMNCGGCSQMSQDFWSKNHSDGGEQGSISK